MTTKRRKKKERTDPHRPGAIIPADYDYEMVFGRVFRDPYGDGNDEWEGMTEAEELVERCGARIHDALMQCDICGAHYMFGIAFTHTPTGEVITCGVDCADKMQLGFNESQMAALRDRAARVRKVVLDRRRRSRKMREWLEQAPAGARKWLKVDHRITRDIRARFIARPLKGISEKQLALLENIYRKSVEEPEAHVPVPVLGKRQTVLGTIVSVKKSEGYYGITTRMTVKVETPEGSWLVNGTLPQGLCDDMVRVTNLRGCIVEFDAAVQAGNRDKHFGFFKRPTKASRLSTVVEIVGELSSSDRHHLHLADEIENDEGELDGWDRDHIRNLRATHGHVRISEGGAR